MVDLVSLLVSCDWIVGAQRKDTGCWSGGISFMTQGGTSSPSAGGWMSLMEAMVCRFKHWATGSHKVLVEFYPLT